MRDEPLLPLLLLLPLLPLLPQLLVLLLRLMADVRSPEMRRCRMAWKTQVPPFLSLGPGTWGGGLGLWEFKVSGLLGGGRVTWGWWSIIRAQDLN